MRKIKRIVLVKSRIQRSLTLLVLLVLYLLQSPVVAAVPEQVNYPDSEIEKKVSEWMERGDIPGLSLVVIRPGRPDIVKGFGKVDIEKANPVTAETLFELASCSKSFTALAILRLESEGKVKLDALVSEYIPQFYAIYKGEKETGITIGQLLHHTSGIPWNAMKYIAQENDENALQHTVENLVGVELEERPGTRYQYSTVNYDILGLVIEQTSGMKYDQYMATYIFQPLGLTSTRVLQPEEKRSGEKSSQQAMGHKISFFSPRVYNAGVYRGNAPSAYIISNARDVSRWLKLQIALEPNPLASEIEKSHERDKTVAPDPLSMSSYGNGWLVSLSGSGYIYHSGENPNFTAFFLFHPERKTAVAVMANSDSTYTSFIATMVMDMVEGRDLGDIDRSEPGNTLDRSFAVVCIILGLYILFTVLFILWMVREVFSGKRVYEGFNLKKLGRILGALPMMAPFLLGIYLFPFALRGLDWETALPWSPVTFRWAIILLLGCFAVSYLGYIFSLFFPHRNKYVRSAPLLLILSVLSGGANAVVIFLVTGALYSTAPLIYMVYYFFLAMLLYILGRKILQTRLFDITFNIVYDLQMRLIEKIFFTQYQKFEKIEHGRVLATLSEDTGMVGNSATVVVTLLTSIITTIGAFVYLATIAFWATLVTIAVIIIIAYLYHVVSEKATVYLEEARDTRNVYMRQLNGLVDGFKELSLHLTKRNQYRDDLEATTGTYRDKNIIANVKFINAFLVGESMLIAVLGAVSFAVPRIFPNIQAFTLMSFIMVLLYLIGPINGILNSIPTIARLGVSWRRIKEFEKEIPANIKPEDLDKIETHIKSVEYIEARGVIFEYEAEEEGKAGFTVGPIDFKAEKGEIIFVIGGNGSGKTTLAKLLTGLYLPHQGSIVVDGKEIPNYQLSEYFSTVYSDYHLFEKLYNVDLKDKNIIEDAHRYLEILHLQGKVEITEDSYTTVELSGGQRKRLALLKCYLENCPIYLFDEVAADQDPEFRKFFYRDLLPRMKEKGKIVIAITHDDHYFDVADKVIKMDMGKIDVVTDDTTKVRVTQ